MNARKTLVGILAAAIAFTAVPAQAVELHGYLRSGIGGNDKSGNQVCFATAPLSYKFRLGNECETYGELEFSQVLYKDRSGVQFSYVGMLAYKTGGMRDAEYLNGVDKWIPDNDGNWFPAARRISGTDFLLRQNYVEAKGIPFLGGASVWAGSRYYHRNDVHILDFYYWDPSGPGVGVDEIDLGGFGKLAVAVFQSKGGWGTGYTGSDKLSVWRPDIRVYGIPFFGGGSLEVGVDLNILSGKNSAVGTDTKSQQVSPMFTVQHVQSGLLGGFNKLAFQWGQGTIAPLSRMPEPQLTDSAKHWRIVEQLVAQPNDRFSGMLAVVYEDSSQQFGDNNTGIYESFRSLSAGVRPVWNVMDYFKLQAEIGYQGFKPKNVDTGRGIPNKDRGDLWKFTIAPTIAPLPSPGGSFFTRPELRLFATYAMWNKAEANYLQNYNSVVFFAGPNGNGPASVYGDQRHGLTFGAQVETWF
ncbi:porin LamB type [Anaeromyxobacter sp. K]|uniref:maltoporin n=1 Tax=Anaeromyxobacter sp. (strain K) TaxID=447217 RepID=UPI00015F9460|nr:carbohydrate porin [Anaeromyxobacter sp. K]ACG75466.1 porin LamB type [Anaeromyxobacter sp. K]